MAITNDGEEINYGSPDKDPFRKLFDALSAVHTTLPVTCGPEASFAQTLCMNGIQESLSNICLFPELMIMKDKNRIWVDGLAEGFYACYQRGILPSETDLSWARRGKNIDLQVEQPPDLFELLQRIHAHYCKEIEVWAQTDIDAINSQIFCMGVKELGERFRGKITFWGEIDRQHLLPSGTQKEIFQAVCQVKEELYEKGGVIAQCEFGLKANPENVLAVFETWDSFHF